MILQIASKLQNKPEKQAVSMVAMETILSSSIDVNRQVSEHCTLLQVSALTVNRWSELSFGGAVRC